MTLDNSVMMLRSNIFQKLFPIMSAQANTKSCYICSSVVCTGDMFTVIIFLQLHFHAAFKSKHPTKIRKSIIGSCNKQSFDMVTKIYEKKQGKSFSV